MSGNIAAANRNVTPAANRNVTQLKRNTVTAKQTEETTRELFLSPPDEKNYEGLSVPTEDSDTLDLEFDKRLEPESSVDDGSYFDDGASVSSYNTQGCDNDMTLSYKPNNKLKTSKQQYNNTNTLESIVKNTRQNLHSGKTNTNDMVADNNISEYNPAIQLVTQSSSSSLDSSYDLSSNSSVSDINNTVANAKPKGLFTRFRGLLSKIFQYIFSSKKQANGVTVEESYNLEHDDKTINQSNDSNIKKISRLFSEGRLDYNIPSSKLFFKFQNYEGTMAHSKRYGIGTAVYENGDQVTTTWDNNFFSSDAKIEYTFANGNVFTGAPQANSGIYVGNMISADGGSDTKKIIKFNLDLTINKMEDVIISRVFL